MGRIASEWSDIAIVTSDNPRNEDPASIIDAIVAGMIKGRETYTDVNRRTAIRSALMKARGGDVVLVAGKGHETYQILKDRTIPLNDREVARRVLRGLGHGAPKK
jgi:UDP-N-acetylmuramoyl-L-alanyl-D-glutamate--2,6-diaminopimelate ligase